jgi:hypothetical protein
MRWGMSCWIRRHIGDAKLRGSSRPVRRVHLVTGHHKDFISENQEKVLN